MLEIKFEQPFSLHMEVVETDKRVPSMRFETKIMISQFQHTFSYQGTFWIECANWSSFTNALSNSSIQSAVLQDISGYFAIKVCGKDGKLILSWEFRKVDIGGSRQTMAAYTSEIDDAMLGKIKRGGPGKLNRPISD